MNNKIFIISVILSICHGQELGVGDTIPSDFGLPLCANEPNEYMMVNDSLYLNAYNGATNALGQYYVIWLKLFTSWCPFCQTEAPITQEIFETYQDSGLIIIGMGFEWDVPYSCEGWADEYGLTYPLLDDENDDDDFGGEGWNLFGAGGVPHNVIINHDMEIVLSVAGYQEEAINSAILDALDSCGAPCATPGCSDILGDIDGTFTIDNEPIINVMDLIKLADIVSLESEIDNCLATTGDLSGDGIINIIDVYALAAMISQGNFDN
tara:strand:- start:111 stop:908 length:798 start_codon:yes stop_codon:yes gene_type:complete